jgi:hypothetical protein
MKDADSQAKKLRNPAREGAEKVSRFHLVITLRENLLRETVNPFT